MSNNKLDKFKTLVSDEKSGWLEKAKYRQENQDWLDVSFSIAVKIMSVLRENKRTGSFPKNQKELAEALGSSPQYVNKLLKGSEKLNIETICKIQKALSIKILNIELKETKIETVSLQTRPIIRTSAAKRKISLKDFNHKFKIKTTKIEIIKQQEVLFDMPKSFVSKHYKELDYIISWNLLTSKSHSQVNEYQSVINE